MNLLNILKSLLSFLGLRTMGWYPVTVNQDMLMKTTFVTTTISVTVVCLLHSLAPAAIVGFEAESGSTPAGVGYRVQNDPAALGGRYIDTDHRDAAAPFGDFAVFREYSVTLPAGTYDLWGRIYAPVVFSYDPDFSDDPDSNEAAAAFENDSFFVAFTFGGDPAVDQDRGNGYGSTGRFDGVDGRANIRDAYAWINLTDGVDLNGLSGSGVDPVASYTTAGGTETFSLMSREGGLRHDAFAFVTDGQTPTEADLNAAIPEPSSALLVVIALGGLAATFRRRVTTRR